MRNKLKRDFMLSNLTWTEYTLVIFLSSAIYYVVVLLTCYRPELNGLLNRKTKIGLKSFAGDPGDLNLPVRDEKEW